MGRRTRIVAVLGAVVVLLPFVLFYESVEEGRCKLSRKKADPESQLIALARQFITPLNDKPDYVQDVPAGFEQPRYYEVKSGDRPILMVADFSWKQVRLCIDADGDGILSEERCLTARLSKETPVSGRRQQLGPISLASAKGTVRTNGAFYINCFRQDGRGLLIPFPAFYRTGRLRLAGRTYRVALVDGDHDGLFKSILSLPLNRQWRLPRCDVFAIDLNHNGTFEISLNERSEIMPLARMVKVGNTYYGIDLTPDGTALELKKVEPELGTLDFNGANVKIKLWSDATEQYLLGSEGSWQLPTGIYSATFIELNEVDLAQNMWTFSSYQNTGSLGEFEIHAGRTTSFGIGPPFSIKTDVQQNRDQISIGLKLEGCGGEQYRLPVMKRSQRQSPPEFKVVNEAGEVLTSGQFEYG